MFSEKPCDEPIKAMAMKSRIISLSMPLWNTSSY
jgi:hypothetical protein